MQLLHKLYGADYRPGYQLREEAKIEPKVQEVGNRCNLPPPNIHDIAHRLECEERYSHRQDNGVNTENGRTSHHV